MPLHEDNLSYISLCCPYFSTAEQTIRRDGFSSAYSSGSRVTGPASLILHHTISLALILSTETLINSNTRENFSHAFS
jgi:hypothetical protein